MRRFIKLIGFLVTVCTFAAGSRAAPQFLDGDIILQTSTSSQSQAIQLATHSKWTHVGIIVNRNGKGYVYEAHGPVGYRTLSAFISSGSGGRYLVRRMKNSLTSSQLSSLVEEAQNYAGKPYDLYFGWSDSRIYCSELVWKIYNRALGVNVGQLQQLGDFDLSSPIVQQILHERYGDDIPYEETVVSPEAIAVSGNLVTVYSN
jgi:uncharacterized protein YycO